MPALEPRFVSLLGRFRIAPERLRQRRSAGPGGHLSRGSGQSLDFSEYRPYQPGDDLRALDWKVYGRTDRLYTKLYVPEQEETVCFVVDGSGSMASKWSFLGSVVMGLATVALGQGDRVSLRMLPRDGNASLEGVAPLRGRSALSRLSSWLEQTRPSGVCELDSAFDDLARRLKSRCHLVVISDFLKEGAGTSGLAQLHYRRHRLTLLQLLSPEELDPTLALSPGEWELRDPEPDPGSDPERDTVRLELGESAFLRYRETLGEHNGELLSLARRTGAIYISASTALSPTSYFSEKLREGGLLL